MIIKKKVIYIVILIIIVIVVVFTVANIPARKESMPEKVEPINISEPIPAAQNTLPNQETVSDTKKIEKKPVVTQPPTVYKAIEHSPPAAAPQAEPVNLQDHSYSISNTKKEINITPGVVLDPGKSVNIKVGADEEVIKIKRDKTYHQGGYNVLWEKKY